MKLRSYQLYTVEQARAARRSGHRRILLAAPTGSGKTVMASAMIQRSVELGDKVLVVAHRKELISQFWSHLTHNLRLEVGVMRGSDDRTNPRAPVQVATVQTLIRRKLPPASLVVVDEAHRCPGGSYKRILEGYPEATIIGLSATPARLDGAPLSDHFDVLVEGARYSELIDEGSIVAPIVYAPRNQPNLSKVRKVHGDYDERQLTEVMSKAHVIGDVVSTWLRHAEGRKTVAFAVGIEHSQALVDRFQAEGVRAAHLDGDTPEEARDQILVDLETGKLDLVSNVGVLCEGWDQPSVKCCIMARPTLSLTLWMQCAGRILRPWGTQPPIILDHAGNVNRHGLPHEDRAWSLDGKAKRIRPALDAFICAGCYAYIPRLPCPLCGFERQAEPRKLVEAPGVLERVDAQIKKERSQDPKRQMFDMALDEARRRGFKPGYAAAKYKDKFDQQWPPWSWSQEAALAYDSDPDWQLRVEKRAREREYWQDKAYQRELAQKQQVPLLEEGGAFDDLLSD